MASAGEYQISLAYACPARDLGAVMEVALGDRRLRARVQTPHDPVLLGAAQDRVPRQESYVKDWAQLVMGALQLPAGRSRLVLRSDHIPGTQALELAGLSLRRIS